MKLLHNMKKTNRLRGSTRKRLYSAGIAAAIMIGSIPSPIFEEMTRQKITASATNKDRITKLTDPNSAIKPDDLNGHTYTIDSLEKLELYTLSYYSFSELHNTADETVILAFLSGGTSDPIDDFIAIGTNDNPFKGTVKIDSTADTVLKIPESFFDYVYDSAAIVDSTTNLPTYLTLSRQNDDTNEPILAKHVMHDPDQESSWNGSNWQIKLEAFTSGSDSTPKSYNFAGFIGEMQKDSKLKIDITDNTGPYSNSDTRPNYGKINISSNGDIGYVCGSMGVNSQLTVNSTGPANVTPYAKIHTSSGNAGGIVGSMDDGSVLTLNCNPLVTNAEIVTDSGYAGGIVGKNDGGTVNIDRSLSTYTINNTISGTSGAGGMFGYYRVRTDDPTTTDTTETEKTISLSKYSITTIVNGTGNIGGLFGELVNKSVTITPASGNTPESRTYGAGGTLKITSDKYGTNTNSFTLTHSAGSASNIGGIAGTYESYDLSDTLEITDVKAQITNNGSYSANMGGAIGLAGTAATSKPYIKIKNFDVNATGCGTRYFGGLVGTGNHAFVDAENVKVTASGFHGGAAVGHMEAGVLKLKGTVNFSGAVPSTSDISSIHDGKIVGYRNNTLIYFDGSSGLSLSSTAIDNVGTWGDILVLDGTKLAKSSILTENSNHTITMTEPVITSGKAAITDANSYAVLSLAMQIAYSDNPIITNSNITAPTTIEFGTSSTGANIDLTGTGLRGLTRDNYIDTNDKKHQSAIASITGNSSTVSLDIENIGGNPVYRHAYNGLIGESTATNLTVTSLNFDGTMKLCPVNYMYAGMAAAMAKGITASTCTVNAAFNDTAGDNTIILGRLAGNVSGNVVISGGTYNGDINAAATAANNCYGGIIGRISSKTTSSFSSVTVSGAINNTASKATQKIGGLVAVIERDSTASSVALSGVTANGLTVNGNATDSCGGLLGYGWYNTDVTVGSISAAGVTVSDGKVNSHSGNAAGLVYCATGKWTVNNLVFTEFSANSDSASFGMIVNKGWDKGADGKSAKQAIYMVLPDGYTYSIASNADSLPTTYSNVYDELVAFSAENGKVTANGQGIVSIHTSNGTLTMDGTSANTYSAKTDLGKIKSNPNTRYYYNLDTIANPSDTSAETIAALTAPVKLMNWGLYQYACSNILSNFCNPFSNGTITNDTYDMVEYSWYPVDVNTGIEVNGTFKFYNYEIEKGIDARADTKYSTLDTPHTQHYLMQNALFNDVNSKLTVGSVTLQGNVGATDDGSGALVYGIVKGKDSSTNGTAEVKVNEASGNGITLDGIHVHNLSANTEYAPLLINKSGNFSTLTIKGVKVDSDNSYKTKTSSNSTIFFDTNSKPKIATSLIGNCGENKDSLNVSVSFSEIQLDGRKHDTLTGDTALDGMYHTDETLFTKATLLNKLIYSTGGGTYEFKTTDDWTGTTHDPIKVTYGSEISDNTERKEFFGQEFWYKDGQETDEAGYTKGYYVNPTSFSSTKGNAGATTTNGVTTWTAPYDFSGFLPYVYTKYSDAAGNDGIVGVTGAHQLKVNHVSASFSGCGTYNDPYIITSGGDLKSIAYIINGEYGSIDLQSICLPQNSTASFDSTATWCSQHASYSINKTSSSVTATNNSDSVDETALRTYLAGAYYKINEGSTITIDTNDSKSFSGLGNINNGNHTFAVFRGVIVGTGTETIINKTNSPLIASSYGSVVRGLTIKVDKNVEVDIGSKAATTPFSLGTAGGGCPYYGAVIGQIFGGDNIIDNVYVDYSDASVTIKGSNPHVIPVGGYVGVLLNGGLYFRNMNNGNVSGLPNDKTYKGSVGVNSESLIYTYKKVNNQRTFTTDPNMKYLYVNPIIGRVMNGFAITETDKFRPFEDGSREYPDGSHVYFDGTNFVEKAAGEEYTGDKVGVTMRNGTKNYSIADVNRNASSTFDMKKNNTTSGDNGATITVHDAQELFLISCITQAGLGQSNNGQYYDEKQYYTFKDNSTHDDFFIKSYTDNMSTHHGNYNEIGNTSSTDYSTLAANDTHSGSTDTIPHIIKTYSPAIDSAHYAAFNITNSENSRFYYMTLANNNNNTQTFYLPDGYRGIGCMLLTTTNDDVLNQRADKVTPLSNISKIKNDDFYMYLAGFEGNENIVSLNMSYYSYGKSNDNYSTPKYGNNSTLDLGFGFFNGIRCKYVTTNDTTKSATKIKNLHLKGSVIFDIKTNTGVSDTYRTDENEAGLLSTGGFTGAVGSDDKNTYYFENISLDKISISGCKFTGGMVGCINLGSGGSGEFHTKNCSADEITVFGGHYAGGMVGLVRNAAAKFVAEFDTDKSFIIKSISSGSDNFGAGGLIGCNRSKTTCNVTNLSIDGAIVRDNNGNEVMYEGTNTPKRLGYIGNSNNHNYSGGIIGYTRRGPNVKLESCEVKNVVVRGRRTGGAIGYISNTENDGLPTAEIISFKLTAENSESKLLSDYNNEAAGSGGVIGYIERGTSNISITDSIINGYTIESPQNAGGLIGKKANTTQSIVSNNIYISDVTIKNTTNSGGLIGHLSTGNLLGYNILTNNITFEKYSSSDMSNCGQIVGNNNSKNIKLVGFSRQGTGIQAKMVGNSSSAISENYGSEGYVVFADYAGTALNSSHNDEFSGINAKASGITGAKANVAAAEPYVTVNDKRMVDGTKFLTGDGIYNSSSTPDYAGSAIAAILSDASNKKYQSYTREPTLADQLNTNGKYKLYEAASGNITYVPALKNLPVLILDDMNKDNTTNLLNGYLRALTNTDMNFKAETVSDVFTVRIATCTYDSNGVLTVDYNAANKSLGFSNSQFALTGTYDNATQNRFTLIDVEFYDPSETSKVAYHLYVPVLVKKMMHYTFQVSTVSGTSYHLDTYTGDARGNTILENIGNPVTVQFSWEYQQSFNEWMSQIEKGENLLWNYDKHLLLKNHISHNGAVLPTNVRFALVDANNNGNVYYADSNASLLTQTGTSNIYYLDLNAFTNSDSQSFGPLDFNDLFDVYDSEPAVDAANPYTKTTVTFVPADSSDATIRTNGGTLYKPGTGNGAKDLWIRYKNGRYVGTGNNIHLKEDYYLTMYTDEDDEFLYHYEFSAPDSFVKNADHKADSNHPSSRKPSSGNASHLYIGDIFDNELNISAGSNSSALSAETNNYIEAVMTATIGVKTGYRTALANALNSKSVKIYQSFILTLNKQYYDDENVQHKEKGIAPYSDPIVTVEEFTVAGTSIDYADNVTKDWNNLKMMSGQNAIIDSISLELRSKKDLRSDIQSADSNTITVVAKVKMAYPTSSQIEQQFPENTDPLVGNGPNIGTYISGSSNLASIPEAASYSKATKSDESDKLYYRSGTRKAQLNYHSAATETRIVTTAAAETPVVSTTTSSTTTQIVTEEVAVVKNKYAQFGVNAIDPERKTTDDSKLHMQTQADYNIQNLSQGAKDSIASIEVRVTLRSKYGDYGDSLPINEFIDSLSLNALAKDNEHSTDTSFVYTADVTKDNFTNDNLSIPITFDVYTGENDNFEKTTYGSGTHRFYSNYMVRLDVQLKDSGGKLVNGSDTDDHIIYSNARIYYDLVPQT
ncbi:MAG: hypothetical protein IKO47_02840 [Ruminococcus sp.]|nr:hypothetical protein [Ruminococcus sp.]